VIEAQGIKKTFAATAGILAVGAVQALRGVDLAVPDGGSVSLIGESGCGKTTLGRILCGHETADSGRLLFGGEDVLRLSPAERRRRLNRVQLIPQDPYAALNPARTLESALRDPLRLRARETGRDAAWIDQRIDELFSLVGLDPGATRDKYPHNLSGGQRQRAVIARALTVDPVVLVADEAVSMIDVSLRLGVLQLLNDLRSRLGISLIFITHDIAAARYVSADGQICVIYRGEVVEYGPTENLVAAPVHPYTQALLSAMPVLRGLEQPGAERFVPAPAESAPAVEQGCLFAPRCPFAQEVCRSQHPVLEAYGQGPDHESACFLPQARRVVPVPLVDNVS
jgi:oligopeptide/dipeptide ABC transporter ATP-binding protein